MSGYEEDGVGLKSIECRHVGMLAPLRRTVTYLFELFMGKRETVITSDPVETSPDTLKDTYVRDSKIASSSVEEPDQETPRYNLRGRKVVNYSEGGEEQE